jgi:predicted O-methyltransferase YrrM
VNFSDPKVAAVFSGYLEREAADAAKMREIGPSAFAIRDELLLSVGVEVGAFLHALILARQPRRILELGTSYGYSTLIMADAAWTVGAKVVTMELADYKQAYARQQLAAAGLSQVVDWRCGDALELLEADPGPWDFVLLDIWKDLYEPCLNAVYPKLSEEGIICADNMIFPEIARPEVRAYRAAVRGKPDLQSTLLPIGQGLEMSVKWSKGNSKL